MHCHTLPASLNVLSPRVFTPHVLRANHVCWSIRRNAKTNLSVPITATPLRTTKSPRLRKSSRVSASMQPLILDPRHDVDSKSSEVILVYLVGALISPEAYIPLAKAIQQASDLKLWVAVLRFENNVVTEEAIPEQYEVLKTSIQTHGYTFSPSSVVYFAGHSLGAFNGASAALRLSQGFIQMGSRLNPAFNDLTEYPKPVLTLAGEYDGQLPLTLFAVTAGRVAALEPQLGKPYLVANKPIVVIKGMNHAQFSSGFRNEGRGDFDSPIPIEEAQDEVGRIVAAFLNVHVKPKDQSRADFKILEKEVIRTDQLLKPFWEAVLNVRSGWEGLQNLLLNLEAVDAPNVHTELLWCSFKENFVYSKPWINEERNTTFAQAHLNPQSTKYSQSHTLWVKLKHPQVYLPPAEASSVPPSQSDVSINPYLSGKAYLRPAADLNKSVFEKALSLCSAESRKRYEEEGKQVVFVDDLTGLASLEWIDADVTFTPVTDGSSHIVEVQSPVLVSPLSGIPERFAGMYYLKVITVVKAMEWILVESFR